MHTFDLEMISAGQKILQVVKVDDLSQMPLVSCLQHLFGRGKIVHLCVELFRGIGIPFLIWVVHVTITDIAWPREDSSDCCLPREHPASHPGWIQGAGMY